MLDNYDQGPTAKVSILTTNNKNKYNNNNIDDNSYEY